MGKSVKTIIILFCIIIISQQYVSAQYATRDVGQRHQQYIDSLKKVDYKYIFPIWGQGAYRKGFDIPYPAGIMANFMWLRQGILIDNLQLGFQNDDINIELTPIDFVKFGENLNTSWTANTRIDLWLFPFLNVYGIFGYGRSETEVPIVSPIEFTSVVDQGISTMGVGVMGAFGLGPVWVSVDANWTWNQPELLDKPVKVNVLGIRVGHTFIFKNRRDRNIAIWGGAMRAEMNTETIGQIALKDALPQSVWDRKDEFVNNYWDWYNSLDPSKPLDQKKIEAADKVLTPIVENVEDANGEGTVKYSMDKQVKQMWNGVFGVQFQLNKRWMFRTEAGLIGDRKSILGSINYRFLI